MTTTTSEGAGHGGSQIEWPADEERRENAAALARMGAGSDAVRRALEAPVTPARAPVDRWVDEQMFEEDVRAVLQMMRPNRQERLRGWAEHRTGGQDFRVTVSWDPAAPSASSPAVAEPEALLTVPRMSEVIASLLIGSARAEADLSGDQECDAYLAVLGEVARRVEELRGSFA
jgi:hypothetical protein